MAKRMDTSEDFEVLINDESDEDENDTGQVQFLNDFEPTDDDTDLEEEEVEIPINVKSSPAHDPLSPAPSGSDPNALTCDVIVSVVKVEEPFDELLDGNNDITTDEHVFHLADEHELFQPSPEGPQHEQERKPLRAQDQGRERGWGCGRRQVTDGVRWVRGDRLIEVNVNDDDVPKELREMVLKVVAARKAAMRAKERRRNEKTAVADDYQGETLFVRGEYSPNFEWSSMDTYIGKRETFLPQKTGSLVTCENAYEAFRQYWDDDILLHIVSKTNQYAAGLVQSSVSFARDWYDTNIHELLVLFSFWMMLGIIRMPSAKSCFSINPLLQTNIFRKMFSSVRYQNLCRALHFVDNMNRPPDNMDPLYCLGPVLEHLNTCFMSVYVPSQEICIEESLTMWRGDQSFRQCYKTKAAQFAVKTYELCESATGYLYSFYLYIGGTTTYNPTFPLNLRKSAATVLKLINPILDQGYTLFMNNWFNSPLLARFLKKRKTDFVGSLRGNHRNEPPLIQLCQLREGEFVARHAGDVSVLAFQDGTEKVTTISTFHGNLQGQVKSKSRRTDCYKPQVVIDYKKYMGCANRKDQMLEPYELERKKCAKWYLKIFRRILNSSILNSRILLQASTGSFKKHLVFRLELVDQILQHHLKAVPKPALARNVRSVLSNSHLTQNNHWPRQITNVLANSGRTSRRRCTWCSLRNHTHRRTRFVCSGCDTPLCIDPCFQLYHSNSNS